MPIKKVDIELPGPLVSDATAEVNNLLHDGEQIARDEPEAREAAERKATKKRHEMKHSLVEHEPVQRGDQTKQFIGGAAGPAAAQALHAWQNNAELQTKLSDAQKRVFREALDQSLQQKKH